MTLEILLITAVTVGLVHTVVGPDHYLPFIVLGRAEGWTLRKTLFWTALCGVGHVLSSVVLGLLGVALGWALSSMERFEGVRGNLAAYGLIGFGLVYFLWGLWRGWRGPHVHVHRHDDGTVHSHSHHHPRSSEDEEPTHERAAHEEPEHVRAHRRTVWTLMIIFLLGPCEPLIPLLMVPAAQHSMGGVALVAGAFGVVTVGMMLIIVALGHMGLRALRFRLLERYVHAVAGATLLVAGVATQVLGI
jgi:ABC-type nickel/cobalt efflux system permease component RcnA